MFETSRTRIAIYAAIAAALLLIGFSSIRGENGPGDTGSEAGGVKNAENSGFRISTGQSKLVVDVSGGVRRPGVYRLEEGSRVIDAIRRAGGALPDSMPGAINRAAKLADGQQVVVPATAREGSRTAGSGLGVPGEPGAVPTAGPGGSAGSTAPVSLGTATAAQLEEIDGIGPVTAAAILEFRDSQGGLASVEELDQVSGIGPVTMEALRAGLVP